ncbi:MAG TPA: hypothetical protein VED41_10165 [Solirubrobacteraceae bacterium]|nr:hypothetical protein [Solirubrobacteraceae bacterium]
MEYAGDPNLDQKVRQRILTAFAEAVRLYREGHNEESRTILRSINDVDPRFSPAQRLEQAIAAGAPVDLGQLIGEVTAQSAVEVDGTLAKARQALSQRDYAGAATLAQAILRELPGHAEARQIAVEAQARQRAAGDVEAHLSRARQALDAGLADEARGFLRLAQNAQADHPEIPALERRLQLAAKPLAVEAEPDFEFEVFEPTAPPTARPAMPSPVVPPLPVPTVPAPGVPRAASAAQPAAGPPPSSPPAVVPPVPAVPPPPTRSPSGATPPVSPGFAFDAGGGVPAMEFESPGEPLPSPAGAPSAPEDPLARIQSLLDQGQGEFDRGDYHAAIDTWSRIYLIDAHHPEAERRIEQARSRKEEAERLAEHRFYEAREAFDQGRWDDARALCQEVLELQPQHLDAHDLLLRLETPAAPPPPPAPALADEDDLFRDDFVPARISSSGSVPAVASASAPAVGEGARPAAARAARRPRTGLSVGWLAVGAGVVVLLVVGVFVLRGKVFSGSAAAVNQAVAEAEKLASSGRLQEAIQLLQSLQGQAEGEQANRIGQRLLNYERRLKAKAAAPKGPDLTPARSALEAGNHVKALALVREALAKAPADPELNRLQAEIVAYSPEIPSLADAVARHNWESVRQLSADLVRAHPGDAEASTLWTVASYNFAVLLLRKYQVAQAHEVLGELAKTANDPDVDHLRQFAKSYLARPADPRYQFFVTDIELRAVK